MSTKQTENFDLIVHYYDENNDDQVFSITASFLKTGKISLNGPGLNVSDIDIADTEFMLNGIGQTKPDDDRMQFSLNIKSKSLTLDFYTKDADRLGDLLTEEHRCAEIAHGKARAKDIGDIFELDD
jgi:hypothetical protein